VCRDASDDSTHFSRGIISQSAQRGGKGRKGGGESVGAHRTSPKRERGRAGPDRALILQRGNAESSLRKGEGLKKGGKGGMSPGTVFYLLLTKHAYKSLRIERRYREGEWEYLGGGHIQSDTGTAPCLTKEKGKGNQGI